MQISCSEDDDSWPIGRMKVLTQGLGPRAVTRMCLLLEASFDDLILWYTVGEP